MFSHMYGDFWDTVNITWSKTATNLLVYPTLPDTLGQFHKVHNIGCSISDRGLLESEILSMYQVRILKKVDFPPQILKSVKDLYEQCNQIIMDNSLDLLIIVCRNV